MKAPELLSPAGTLRNMRYACAYGADAVYAGMPRYSLRVRNNDFLLDNLKTGIAEVQQQGKRFFVTANVIPHGAKIKTFLDDMRPIAAMKPDAIIVADPGLVLLIRENWPDLPLHLSVQANSMNAQAVRFWQQAGIERVILSRELSLDEIGEIRQECPDIELEVFVHGALCIAYSGRCLLSGYFNHRDANQGACTNACRWEYRLGSSVPVPQVATDDSNRHEKAKENYYLEEPGRPGEQMPIYEDKMGTYIMNSKDLRAIEHVRRLIEIGVDSLKIEGRTKSHYYAARATQAYRRAIDDVLAAKPFDPSLIQDLEGLANRGYTDGFYQRHETHELQNYRSGVSRSKREQFVAEINPDDKNKGDLIAVISKNRFALGDQLRLITPQGNHDFVLDYIEDIYGQAMNLVPGGGHNVRIKLPQSPGPMSLITKYLGEKSLDSH